MSPKTMLGEPDEGDDWENFLDAYYFSHEFDILDELAAYEAAENEEPPAEEPPDDN